jgi:dihydropyrimidine dehydrogenase (NAD+) subunit PreA
VVNVSSRYGGVNYRNNRLIGLNNIELITDRPLRDNLVEIEEVKKYFPDHAVIASLMVESKTEWHQIVKDVENAGCDGIELNFGCPHGMCERGMGSAVGQEPAVLKTIVEWVKEVSTVPVIVKLTPNISDITEPAQAALDGGGDAISLINTVQSLVGVDIDNFVPYPVVDGKSTNGGYCGPAVKPIALNMVKNCAQHPGMNLPISGIGGIENWRDAVEYMLLGATNVQVCTAVMHFGFGIIREMIPGLENYMREKGFNNLGEMTGKALQNVTTWENLNLNYKVVAEIDESKCIGCQLCYVACEDGAHQAIGLNEDEDLRIPNIIEKNCVGCNLCAIVCPVEDCISMERRDDGSKVESWKDRSEVGKVPTTFNDELAGGIGHWVPKPTDALKKS